MRHIVFVLLFSLSWLAQAVEFDEHTRYVLAAPLTHGTSTYLEVLTAQQSLLSSQLTQISDRFDEIQGIVNLYQALGGGRDMDTDEMEESK